MTDTEQSTKSSSNKEDISYSVTVV